MKTNGFTCACGREYGLRPRGDPGTHKFQQSTPTYPSAPAQPAAPVRKEKSHAREWDVVVPVQVAGISGMLLALWMLLKGSGLHLALQGGICVTGIIWGVAIVLFFLSRLVSLDAVLWWLEARFGVDIDGDGAQGEPKSPGRTVINGGKKNRRPRYWRNLTAAKQQDDRIDFAARVWRIEEAAKEKGKRAATGQAAMKKYVLPSGFKIGPIVHALIVKDLIECGAAEVHGNGFRLCAFGNVTELTDYIREQITAGE